MDWSCVVKRTRVPSKQRGIKEARGEKTTRKTQVQVVGLGDIRHQLQGGILIVLAVDRKDGWRALVDETKSKWPWD